MLANLERALNDKGISKRVYAAILNVSEKTVQNKINEETPITYQEARKTKLNLFPEYDMDYLFRSDCEGSD